MKILKILLILLVPAIGIVGCKKSDMKPGCAHNKSSETTTEVSGRLNTNVISNTDQQTQSTDVVGSGDDDRDGGDKPKKIGSK